MSTTPVPAPDAVTEPFWSGGTENQLRMQRCDQCAHLRFPPSPVCPRCLSEQSAWVDTSGAGEILSYVVFHRAYDPQWASRVPYAVLLVQTDDGPRMFSDFSGSLDRLSVGARVHVTFSPLDGPYALPSFDLDTA